MLAAFVVLVQGSGFVRSVRPDWHTGNDFFQDWASARNVLDGMPAYLPISDAVSRHVPRNDDSSPPTAFLPWNAHPPTSVIACLPLALLDYSDAGAIWNVLGLVAIAASLALIVRELGLPVATWAVLPIATLGLLCNPIRMQVSQGQWSGVLLLLLTLTWVADRRGQGLRAGLWVGTSAALKLFPAFFLLYFLLLRRWRTVLSGAICLLAETLLTAAILGVGAYRDYIYRVTPTLAEFRSSWVNASVLAFWMKNFWSGATHWGLYAAPLFEAPMLARVGIIVSYAAVLGALAYFANKATSGFSEDIRYRDICFSLGIGAMLLLAPICWDHYLLLLALPLCLIWMGLGTSALQRMAFLMLVAAFWLGPNEIWRAGGVDILTGWRNFETAPPRTYRITRPLFVPVFLSLHFYALVALYLWLVSLARREIGSSRA